MVQEAVMKGKQRSLALLLEDYVGECKMVSEKENTISPCYDWIYEQTCWKEEEMGVRAWVGIGLKNRRTSLNLNLNLIQCGDLVLIA